MESIREVEAVNATVCKFFIIFYAGRKTFFRSHISLQLSLYELMSHPIPQLLFYRILCFVQLMY